MLGGAWILASETCALDIIGAEFVRDVEPGELVVIDGTELRSLQALRPRASRASASSNTSISPGPTASSTAATSMRRASASARELARESAGRRRHGRPGAGFRRARGARLCQRGRHAVRARHHPQSLCRPHLHRADRPDPPSGRAGSSTTPTARMLEGKRVILVDDSIVRGTTSTKIVEMVREAGATRGAYAHLEPAHHPFLLLRHRHARARQAAGLAYDVDEMAKLHRRRQPRLRLDRRALPRHGRAGARRGQRRNSATPASPATIRSR